ncbi:MAG: D-alanyl-D-alanine carboxypeptidase/D-alanyl-D-alanine-endopeptidase [Candidatus Solibacter usitatus]|nr:D-alanyl-D-alanine carboxypeptidase/D-alanyl-D-alanine-endopeptidase [Candidatus Solibacter usitatus]
MRNCLIALISLSFVCGAQTKKVLDALLTTKEARSAHWGIHVVHLKTGKTIYQVNAEEHFTPASNTKLFTTALALSRLGVEHRFRTTVRVSRKPGGDGVVNGDLRLVGGGDPTLSGRAYPYDKDAQPGDPLLAMEQIAGQVVRSGVREIRGDVIGDDRLYVFAPYPEGWTINDSIWEYGAPVSALTFNDNAFTVSLIPALEPGQLALLSMKPGVIPLVLDNRVMTKDSGRAEVSFDRASGSRQLRINGSMPLRHAGVSQKLAVDDPALYAATALLDALTRHGVRIHGSPASLHRERADEAFDPAEGIEIAHRDSPPLVEVARVVDKVSQNLHAELLLREVARVKGGEATREKGLDELKSFLTGIGVVEDAFHFEDGSGLSRRTLVTPIAVTTLLRHMSNGPIAAEWDSLLPVAGFDGTLERRFGQAPVAKAIHAKTGTLATANALGGSVRTKRGDVLVFSIIANNHTGASSNIRRVIDKIGLALLDWEGK